MLLCVVRVSEDDRWAYFMLVEPRVVAPGIPASSALFCSLQADSTVAWHKIFAPPQASDDDITDLYVFFAPSLVLFPSAFALAMAIANPDPVELRCGSALLYGVRMREKIGEEWWRSGSTPNAAWN